MMILCCHILGLGHVTSDKQTPSAVDYLGHFLQAIELEKRMQKQGQSKPLKDMLNGLCATYNKMAVSKKHKIDSHKRGLIYNLFLVCFQKKGWVRVIFKIPTMNLFIGFDPRLRAPANFHKLLHSHYDFFRHETSGPEFSHMLSLRPNLDPTDTPNLRCQASHSTSFRTTGGFLVPRPGLTVRNMLAKANGKRS